MIEQLKYFLKSFFTKPTIGDGCLGVGDTESNFTFGSVKNLSDVLKNSVSQDTIITQYQQNNWFANMFCTAVAPICAIASQFNRELTDADMYKFFLYAKKEYGYKIGVGNNMSVGVDAARNYWNTKLAKDGEQVLSFLTQLGSKDAEDCLDKGYGLCFCYSGNDEYNKDKRDRKLDGTNFGARTYGHCTQLYKIKSRHRVYDSNKGEWDDKYIVHEGNFPELIKNNRHTEAYVFLKANTIIPKPKSKLQIYLNAIKLKNLTSKL